MVFIADLAMHIYRLCKESYATLDGYGAFLYGGRWNFPGKAVVYTAENRALAALEFLVGVEHHRALGTLLMLTIQVPDELAVNVVEETYLPAGWRAYPAAQTVTQTGDAWAGKGETCVLKVPSVHVPEEYNYLLNPRHPDISRVTITDKKIFRFDDRFL